MRSVVLALAVLLGVVLSTALVVTLLAVSFVGEETERGRLLAITAEQGERPASQPQPMAQGDRPYAVTEAREPCDDYRPERRPLFGDLHVHTARSQDASTQDTRTTPADAYRFARGEAIGIQPWTDDGRLVVSPERGSLLVFEPGDALLAGAAATPRVAPLGGGSHAAELGDPRSLAHLPVHAAQGLEWAHDALYVSVSAGRSASVAFTVVTAV